MEEIKLFPHNEEAYQAILKSLENSNFSFIERATGTGKSYILIKFLAEQMKGKRVLFVTTHEPMFKQFVTQDMTALGVGVNTFDKLDLIIYSNINKKDASWYYENYDCFVFDEAHHCGAPVWGETIGELRDLVKDSEDKVMIGATATAVRYLDNYTDVAELFFENNVASRLSLSDAILNEILPAPLYINICGHVKDDINRINRKLGRIGNLPELEEIRRKTRDISESFELEKDINKLLKENEVKEGEKYIVFCSNKEELYKKMEESKYWFEELGNIETYSVHSGKRKDENQKQIDEFASTNPNAIKVMFAIDIFNEGMHVPNVDGVIMARKTTSPIVYLQQIGRALSFSSRKKQIKIFDIVGNASNIDVVNNLYREILYTIEDKLNTNPENTEHYQQILERFKIIEKGNKIIDSVNEIEEILDNEYIIKDQIERNIKYLEYFCSITNENFMDLLKNKKLDKEHKKIYDELCKCKNDLNIDHIYRLNLLGIKIASWQDDEKAIEQIKIHGNIRKAIDNDFQKTMHKYNEFYLKNKRRPSPIEFEEAELFNKYRTYLSNINHFKLKDKLKEANYKLNVEELLVMNVFPSKLEIEDYLNEIENKYSQGIKIDNLEIKTLKKIRLIKDALKNRPEIKKLLSNKTLEIDQALHTIKNKINDYYPAEKQITLELIKLDEDSYNAYKYIIKNYKYITNTQFQQMLEMNIELTDELNMTMEERLQMLYGCESIYELENLQKRKTAKALVEFINKTGRRPLLDEPLEKGLYEKYNELMNLGNSTYMNEIGNALESNNIPLTLEEKIITNRKLEEGQLNILYEEVMTTIENCNINSFAYENIKNKIDYLKKHNKIDYRLYTILIRTINLINQVFKGKLNSEIEIAKLENKIKNNKDLIPIKLLPYIKSRGIHINAKIEKQFKKLDKQCINFAHSTYKNEIRLYHEFIQYLEKHKRRPEPQDHYLNLYIANYLIESHIEDIERYLTKLNDLGIPITEEEMYMGNKLSDETIGNLHKKLLLKEKTKALSHLERFVLNDINLNAIFQENIRRTNTYTFTLKKEASNAFIEGLKVQIKENPYEKLDFENELKILTNEEKELLKEFQIECLAFDYLSSLVSLMKNKGIPLSKALEQMDKTLYEEIKSYNNKNHQYDILFSEIEKLNKANTLKYNAIVINDFIEEYFNFVSVNKRLPSPFSSDIVEKLLAEKYEQVYSVSNTAERKQLVERSKKIIKEHQKKEMCEKIEEFAELNKRMPSILSDDLEEVELAKLYQKYGSELSKEYKSKILMLQKKYQNNTIEYFKNKKGSLK
ncbi:MAG: DEAD/DEAH box helicase family protein [Bacilli bacterium]|nr:DEAD/DEAH box helicase family protein [Bacilli bacterium]